MGFARTMASNVVSMTGPKLEVGKMLGKLSGIDQVAATGPASCTDRSLETEVCLPAGWAPKAGDCTELIGVWAPCCREWVRVLLLCVVWPLSVCVLSLPKHYCVSKIQNF